MKKDNIKELVNYLIVGILTTIVSYGVYYLITISMLDPNNKIELQIANIISWICAVVFAYFTNRKYVFKSKEKNMLKEGSKFCLSRVFTLLLDMLTMFIMVSLLHINDRLSKLVSQVLITIGNYIISKFFVFNKKDNKKTPVWLKTLLILMTSIVGGTLLLVIIYLLPTDRMEYNALEVADTFEVEGTYPRSITRYPNTQLDNYSDAIIINEAIYKGTDSVIDKAMYVYRDNKEGPVTDLISRVRGDTSGFKKSEYGRYWHGNVIFTKLLLLVFNYSQIRLLNTFVQTILLMFILYLMIKKNLLRNIYDFVVSLFLIFPFILGMSLQYSSVYYIFLISLILMLKYNDKLKDKYIYFFLVIGILTSYFDLLTFPILALGMPIIFNYMLNRKEKTIDNILDILKYSIFWSIGYFGMWCGKWMVGSLLCEDNFFELAFAAAKYRSSSDIGRINTVIKNIKVYINIGYLIILLPSICYHSYLIFKNRKNITKTRVLESSVYIIISLIPIVWYLVMSEHSSMHYWFTNKSLVVSIYGGLLFLDTLHLKGDN